MLSLGLLAFGFPGSSSEFSPWALIGQIEVTCPKAVILDSALIGQIEVTYPKATILDSAGDSLFDATFSEVVKIAQSFAKVCITSKLGTIPIPMAIGRLSGGCSGRVVSL
jgi:hypothetical protein